MPEVKINEGKPFICPNSAQKPESTERIQFKGMITVDTCKTNACGFFVKYEKGKLTCSKY